MSDKSTNDSLGIVLGKSSADFSDGRAVFGTQVDLIQKVIAEIASPEKPGFERIVFGIPDSPMWRVADRENIAFLTTMGFENWLEIEKLHLQIAPESVRPAEVTPLRRDMVFGVNERTLASGEIQRSVDPSEIQFLLEKLKLLEIEDVAIGLLHSTVNSGNEVIIRDLCKQAGLRVHASHEFEDSLGQSNEVYRFWNCIDRVKLAKKSAKIEKRIKNHFLEQQLPLPAEFHFKCFSPEKLVSLNWPNQSPAAVLQAGFEGITLFNKTSSLNLRPGFNAKMKMDPYLGFSSANNFEDWEPGPMIRGRASHPWVLDMIVFGNPSGLASRLPFTASDKFDRKIGDYLMSQKRADNHSDTSLSSYLDTTLSGIYSRWVSQILKITDLKSNSSLSDLKIYASGPLAPILAPLKSKLNLTIADDLNFSKLLTRMDH